MTDPTPQTTPTRDEAVRKACHVLRQWAAFFNDDSARQSVKEIIDLLASAPAPASGGVDAAAREPVSKAVERILDEHSAWIAAPNPEVVGRIAFAATLAADVLAKQEKAAEDSVRDALWAGKPFVFDPATGFAHADDGGAPAGGVRWEPTAECDPCMWDQDKPCTCGGATWTPVSEAGGGATGKPSLQVADIPRAPNTGRYLAETNDGRLLYLNHANEWQEMPNILANPASSPAGGDVVREALAALLDHVDRETCTHEETHRGGFIWTICDQCGRKWADDQGGFVPHTDPPAVARARLICEGVASQSTSAGRVGE